MSQQNLGLEPETTPNAEEPRLTNAEREAYRARLAEKLKDPEFRKIEGFPIGTDEAILALSDPPYYTACPNPFIKEWLQENAKPYDASTDDYHREPFAADVSEGKNDPIYNAHSYHTKVPHKAIMRYILHYTEPGDVVYDGFCGTGMTGVAAQMCGDKAQVQSLGYTVQTDGAILNEEGRPFSKLGARKAILNDLSPAATFIAYNYNTPVDAAAFEREAKRILSDVEEECGWMYSTLHDASPRETQRITEALRACKATDELRTFYRDLKSRKSPLGDTHSNLQMGIVNFVVMSDVLQCPSCGGEIVFFDEAFDSGAKRIRDKFQCPKCRTETTKSACGRANESYFDSALNRVVKQVKQVPVFINYSLGKKRQVKFPDEHDIALASKIASLEASNWFPADRMPEGSESRRNDPVGLTHAHHFYTPSALHAMSAIWERATCYPSRRSAAVMLAHSAANPYCSKLRRFRPDGKGGGPLAGTLYIGSIITPPNVMLSVGRNAGDLAEAFRETNQFTRDVRISIGSSSKTSIPDNSLDYVFTDPPFGGNLMYSELNFLWEAWLQVQTNNALEAITSDIQKKHLAEYQEIMTRCFAEYYRVLKSGHWMTVEFHNSANSVWNAIQEGLERVGFVVADVRVLDKQQSTFKQVTSSGAVKQDLVISCYKPRYEFEERFRELQGKPEGVTEFLREHLAMLPVTPINKAGKLETVAERTRFLLFDRMVAYHLQRGARIPLSAAEFYNMLEEEFVERDEMFFLPDDAAHYDALKARGVETEQLSIFVRDEKTAVQWVRSQLNEQPQTLGDLRPKFMQEQHGWDSHEPFPELEDLLREYFIKDSSMWRVPDPNNEKDLEALRHSALLKRFRDYVNAKGPLKVFRKEAVLEGFRHCWDTRQYGVIVAVCEKIPDKILQEIHEFVQFYDIAKDLAPQMSEQMAFSWE